MNESNYKNYQAFKDWSSENFGHLSIEDEIYFQKQLFDVGIKNIKNKRILEIGFGNGAFASWCKKNNCEYFGTELIPELVNAGKSKGLNVFSTNIKPDEIVQKSSLDFVIAFDVFEHLSKDEIDYKLQECFKILKSNGLLVARVPSGDSPFSSSIQNGDFTHKIALGSSMIKQFAKTNGFKIKTIQSPAMPLTGLGIKSMIRRFFIGFIRLLTYPIIRKVFMGGDNIVLSPNMIFVLEKP